jgi:dTDP-4-dehydrorhamnose reductase
LLNGLQESRGALVVRTGPLLLPDPPDDSLVRWILQLRRGETLRLPGFGRVRPTLLLDAVLSSLDLLVDGASGIWHLARADAVSWKEVVSRVATHLGVSPERATALCVAPTTAWDGALVSERHAPLRSWEEAVRQAIAACDALPSKEKLYA